MKALLTSFASALLFSLLMACSGNAQKGTLTVGNLLANPASYVGQTVTVEGLCTHVCSKSGMKLFMADDADGQTIRVESNATLGKFDKETAEKIVVVRGTLVEEKITEADLQEMENEIAQGTTVTHGEGGEGCETEQKAEGTTVGSSEMERVNGFRARITERKAAEGKDYLSLYHIAADWYKVN